jgi:hypothetical protein
MKRIVMACLGAIALATLACAGSGLPTRPSATTPVSDQAIGSPAAGLVRAVAHCRGPVIEVLREALGAAGIIVTSDDGSTFTFTFTPSGNTHQITYIDNDGSGSLSCGDAITGLS